MKVSLLLACSLALVSNGCRSLPDLRSASLTLVAENQGSLQQRPAITALAFAPGGTQLAAGDFAGGVLLFEQGGLDGPTQPEELEKGRSILSLCWSEDSQELYAVTRSGTLWRRREGRWSKLDDSLGFLTDAVVDASGRVAAVSLPRRRLLFRADAAHRFELEDIKATAVCLAGSRIFYGTGKQVGEFRLHSMDADGAVHWSRPMEDAVSHLLWEPDQKRLVVTGEHSLTVLEGEPAVPVCSLPLNAPGLPVSARDGRRTFLLVGEEVLIFDHARNTLHQELAVHRGEVRAGAAAGNLEEAWLATGGSRGDLRLWRLHAAPPGGPVQP